MFNFLEIIVNFAPRAFAVSLRDLNPLGSETLDAILPKVADSLFEISLPIVAIMVLVGAFQMMTAAGNPEKFSSGRKTILYAAVGFAVVLLAKSVTLIIQSVFE